MFFLNIDQSFNNKKINVFMSVAFLWLSWFDVSLFATRINMTIRKCNALLKISHMIAFDIVHVVRLYSNWEGELSSKRILLDYVISILKQMGETRPIDER